MKFLIFLVLFFTTIQVKATTIEFYSNGIMKPVKADTGTPANSIPFPMRIHSSLGVIVDPNLESTQQSVLTQVTDISGKLPATLGQKTSAASLAVVLASDQSAININNISGTISLPTGAATSALQTTGNTSLSTIATNTTGASTAANQATANTSLSSIVTNTTGLQLQTGANNFLNKEALAVSITALNDASTIDTDGAATLGIQITGTWSGTVVFEGSNDGSTYFAIQCFARSSTGATVTSTTANTQLMCPAGGLSNFRLRRSVATSGTAVVSIAASAGASMAQIYQLNANNLLVSAASTQSGTWSVRLQDGSGTAVTSEAVGSNRALHVKSQGAAFVTSARNDYSSVSVTTGAWVQLIASTASDCQGVLLFDSSGQTLELGVGAAASEARVLLIPPGGHDGYVPLRIPSGSRVSIRAVSATASVGEIDLNLL